MLATSVHTHEVGIDVVLIGETPCKAGTAEYVVGVVAAGVVLLLETVAVEIACICVSVVLEAHVAVVETSVCIELAAAYVDIGSGIVASFAVAATLHATVIACLAVTLENDVDDTGSSFGRMLCRWVGDDLNLLD